MWWGERYKWLLTRETLAVRDESVFPTRARTLRAPDCLERYESQFCAWLHLINCSQSGRPRNDHRLPPPSRRDRLISDLSTPVPVLCPGRLVNHKFVRPACFPNPLVFRLPFPMLTNTCSLVYCTSSLIKNGGNVLLQISLDFHSKWMNNIIKAL